jgi:hypothetical protein
VRQRTNGDLDTHPKSPAAGKSPVANYTEKRRQQNRNSQIAFRQRSKMTMKLMQEELGQSLLTNEALSHHGRTIRKYGEFKEVN